MNTQDIYILIILGASLFTMWLSSRKSRHPTRLDTNNPTESRPKDGSSIMNGSSKAVVLGDLADPLMIIQRLSEKPISGYSIIGDVETRNVIAAAAGPAFQVLSQASNLGRNFFEMTLKPELIDGLATGKLEIMAAIKGGYRSSVVDTASRKIVGNGQLLPTKAPQAAALASISFQIGSVVFGQAHMAQITAKLGEIERSLTDIKSFQIEGRKSKILTGFGTLRYIREVLRHPDIDIDERRRQLDQLQTLENVISEIMEQLHMEGDRRVKALYGVESQDIFGSKKTYALLTKHFDEFEEFQQTWNAAYILLSATQALMVTYASKATIIPIAKKLDGSEQLLQSSRNLRLHLHDFFEQAKSLFDIKLFTGTTLERRENILKRINSLYWENKKYLDSLHDDLHKVQQLKNLRLEAINNGTRVLIETNSNGDVLDVAFD